MCEIHSLSDSLVFYAYSLCQLVSEQGKFPVEMSGDGSLGGGHVPDVARDMEALRTEVQAQRAVLDTMGQRFQREERRFDDLIPMRYNTNRYRNIDRRRPRAADAYGYPISRPVAANYGLYECDSEEEEDMLLEDQPLWRRGYGGDVHRRSKYHGYDQGDGGNFRLKVNIPKFYGNYNIEEFLDWLDEVERFFNYMKIPEEQRVRLVACRLRDRASAWWERL